MPSLGSATTSFTNTSLSAGPAQAAVAALWDDLITTAGARLCALAEGHGMAVLPHYSPGYADWDIADQAALQRLLDACTDRPEEAAAPCLSAPTHGQQKR